MAGTVAWVLVNILAFSISYNPKVTRYPKISIVVSDEQDIKPEITLLTPGGVRFAIRGNTNDTQIFCVYMNVNKPLTAQPPYHDMHCEYYGYVFNIYPPADLVWTCTDYTPRFGDIVYYSLKVIDRDSASHNRYGLNMTILKDGSGNLLPVFDLPYSDRVVAILETGV